MNPNGHYADQFVWTIEVQPVAGGWSYEINGPDGTEAWTDTDLTPDAMDRILSGIRDGTTTTARETAESEH